MTETDQITVFAFDLVDAACMCYAGLAQDAPYDERHYLNSVLNILFGYLSAEQKFEVEDYLLQKKYLPPVDIKIAKS